MSVYERVHALHRVLVQQSFYPLALASAFVMTLLIGRGYLNHTGPYTFLWLDLLLAWVPYLLSTLLVVTSELRRRHAVWRVLLGLVWVLFFPNAPYLLTEVIQLHEFAPQVWVWYDTILFAAVALSGCFLAMASLYMMQTLARRILGRLWGWVFVCVMLLLTGFAIYLGRFLRWNSWDVVVNPHGLVADTVSRLRDPLSHVQVFGFIGLCTVLLFICYAMFLSMRATPRWDRPA